MRNSQLDILCKCSLFTGLNSHSINEIADKFGEVSSCEKNEIIFSEEKYSRSIVIILKGSASVTKNNGNERILMNILKAGDVFGMAALFYEQSYFLTEIKATEKVNMLTVSKDNLKKIFAEYPVVSENYITILSEKIHFLNMKINTYTKSETIQKVALFILQYADKNMESFVFPYSITDTAEALNTGRASVYRALGTLEESGIIKRDGKKIKILDYKALKNQ